MITLKNLAEASVYADEIDIFVYDDYSNYDEHDDALGYWHTSLLEVLNFKNETAFKNYLNYEVMNMDMETSIYGTHLFIDIKKSI